MMNLHAHIAHRPPPQVAGDYLPRRQQAMSTKRQKLIAAGKCVNYFRCGNERGEEGTETMCRPCAVDDNSKRVPKLRRRRRENVRRGLCFESACKSPVHRGKTRCRQHLIEVAERNKRYRERLKGGSQPNS
jgi:hypothetical protein